MDIKKYLEKFTNPNNAQITGLTICADLDKSNIDLQDIYNQIKPSNESIQFVSYNENYKHATEVSKSTQKTINRLNKSNSIKKINSKPFFKNCIICKHDMLSIKIFKTGKLQLTSKYNDSDLISDNVKIILSLLKAKITNIKIASSTFRIKIKSIDLTNMCYKKDDVNILHNHIENSETLRYKSSITCNVFPTTIIGFANSYDAIKEFVDFIKDYVQFEEGIQSIFNDDIFFIKICI